MAQTSSQADVTSPWRYLGPPLTIAFPVANVSIEVQHQLGEIPDGWQIVNADCLVKRTPGKLFTKTIAYLQADVAPSSAIVCFGVLRQGATSVNA